MNRLRIVLLAAVVAGLAACNEGSQSGDGGAAGRPTTAKALGVKLINTRTCDNGQPAELNDRVIKDDDPATTFVVDADRLAPEDSNCSAPAS